MIQGDGLWVKAPQLRLRKGEALARRRSRAGSSSPERPGPFQSATRCPGWCPRPAGEVGGHAPGTPGDRTRGPTGRRRSPRGPRPRLGVEPKPVRHQVAPAAAHGAGSVPAGFVTTTSNGPASGPRSSRDLGDELGDGLGAGEVDREHAVPARGAPDRAAARPARREPDRDPRASARGRGSNSPSQNAVSRSSAASSSRACSRGSSTSPNGASSPWRVAAEAEPEHEPAAAQVVERDRLARELLHAPPRRRRDHRADAHALGRARDRAQRHPRVGARRGPAASRRCGPRRRSRPSRAPRRARRAARRAAGRRARRTGRGRSRARGHQRTGTAPSSRRRGGARTRSPGSRRRRSTIAPPISVAVLGFSSIGQPHPQRPEHDLEQRDERDLRRRDQPRADRQEREAEPDLARAERGEREARRRPASSPARRTAGTTRTRKICARQVAGSIETSRRWRLMTIETANENAISSDRRSPTPPPSPGPPIITPTPASATAIATAGPRADRLAERDPGEQRREHGRHRLDEEDVRDRRVVQRDDERARRRARPRRRSRSRPRPTERHACDDAAALGDRDPRERGRRRRRRRGRRPASRCRPTGRAAARPRVDHASAASATYTCPRRCSRCAVEDGRRSRSPCARSQPGAGAARAIRARRASTSASASPPRAAAPRRRASAGTRAPPPRPSCPRARRNASMAGLASSTPRAANSAGSALAAQRVVGRDVLGRDADEREQQRRVIMPVRSRPPAQWNGDAARRRAGDRGDDAGRALREAVEVGR